MSNGAAAVEIGIVSPQKLKNKIYHMILQFPFWVYAQNNWMQGLKYVYPHPRSQQRYSQELKHGRNPTVHQRMNG